jgi:leader peptidase (prepilin peptidase) / N-methyltransferase
MNEFLILYTVFGLIIGSFLNVCIYRIPRRESIVFPGSHCPACGKPIRAFDNIPVFAFLWLGGKCRSCRAPISFQYPLVEALSGLSFYACAITWGPAPATFVNSLLVSMVIVLFFVDYHHQILPNVITLPGAIAGILLSPWQDPGFYMDLPVLALTGSIAGNSAKTALPLAGSIIGALIGGGILLFVGAAYSLVRKKQGLGMGDIKMMALVGAFLGWRLALLTIFAGSFLGSFLGIFLIFFKGRSLQSKMAFGTFLGIGTVFSLFYGLDLLAWYLKAR